MAPPVAVTPIEPSHDLDEPDEPADDRRHYVAWSDFTKEDFSPEYWNRIWRWYHTGGFAHVAAYLAELDISSFDPKAPPPQTPGKDDMGVAVAPARRRHM